MYYLIVYINLKSEPSSSLIFSYSLITIDLSFNSQLFIPENLDFFHSNSLLHSTTCCPLLSFDLYVKITTLSPSCSQYALFFNHCSHLHYMNFAFACILIYVQLQLSYICINIRTYCIHRINTAFLNSAFAELH